MALHNLKSTLRLQDTGLQELGATVTIKSDVTTVSNQGASSL